MNTLNMYKYFSFMGNLFLLNCLFVFFNFPFLLILFFYPISLENIIFLMPFTLLLTPSIVALLATCGRWQREKEVAVIHDYFRDFKKNFKLSFIQGALTSSMFFVLIIDALWSLREKNTIFFVLILLLLSLGTMMYVLQCSIIGRFEISFKSLLRIGIYGTFHYFFKLFLASSCLIILLAIFFIAPAIAMTIGFASIGYFMMTYLLPLLTSIEKEFRS